MKKRAFAFPSHKFQAAAATTKNTRNKNDARPEERERKKNLIRRDARSFECWKFSPAVSPSLINRPRKTKEKDGKMMENSGRTKSDREPMKGKRVKDGRKLSPIATMNLFLFSLSLSLSLSRLSRV